MVKIPSKINKQGNSMMIYIPATISKEMKFTKGDMILMDIVDEKLIVEKV